jgi:alkaline phosphatase D
VVLWTRLAPQPTAGGGMPDRPVAVHWEVAEDDRFRRVRQRGTTTAVSAYAHSVHVEVSGLRPDTEYYYRFRAGNGISPVGRTRTAPAPWARKQRLRFAFASCQDYQAGYYTAHQHLVDTVWQPTATVRTAAEFVIESGVPGIAAVTQETPGETAQATARTLAGPQYAVQDDQP